MTTHDIFDIMYHLIQQSPQSAYTYRYELEDNLVNIDQNKPLDYDLLLEIIAAINLYDNCHHLTTFETTKVFKEIYHDFILAKNNKNTLYKLICIARCQLLSYNSYLAQYRPALYARKRLQERCNLRIKTDVIDSLDSYFGDTLANDIGQIIAAYSSL